MLMSTTTARSTVACSTTVATLLAAVSSAPQSLGLTPGTRVGVMIHNSTSATLYVKFGSGASSTDYDVALVAGATYESQAVVWMGIITGILSTGTGDVRVVEFRL